MPGRVVPAEWRGVARRPGGKYQHGLGIVNTWWQSRGRQSRRRNDALLGGSMNGQHSRPPPLRPLLAPPTACAEMRDLLRTNSPLVADHAQHALRDLLVVFLSRSIASVPSILVLWTQGQRVERGSGSSGSPPVPERFVGFGELLRQAEQAQTQV